MYNEIQQKYTTLARPLLIHEETNNSHWHNSPVRFSVSPVWTPALAIVILVLILVLISKCPSSTSTDTTPKILRSITRASNHNDVNEHSVWHQRIHFFFMSFHFNAPVCLQNSICRSASFFDGFTRIQHACEIAESTCKFSVISSALTALSMCNRFGDTRGMLGAKFRMIGSPCDCLQHCINVASWFIEIS